MKNVYLINVRKWDKSNTNQNLISKTTLFAFTSEKKAKKWLESSCELHNNMDNTSAYINSAGIMYIENSEESFYKSYIIDRVGIM